jgi:hypothetical protein
VPTADCWDDVRRLLASCPALNPCEQKAEPELARAIEEFTATARSYEKRRAYLDRRQGRPGEAQADEVPVARPATANRLISPIFLPVAEPVEPEPAAPPPAPAARKRLLSPLFDPPGEKRG